MSKERFAASNTFLVRPLPYQFETLESYLLRVGFANGFKDKRWISKVLPTHKRIQDITIKDREAISNISKFLGVHVSLIEKLTLKYYVENYVLTDFNLNYEHKTRKISKEVQYCPLCLKDKKCQQVFWLLAYLRVCPIHNIDLISKCEVCGGRVSVVDLISGSCRCRNDLCNVPTMRRLYHFNDLRNREIVRSIIIGIQSSGSIKELYPSEFRFLYKRLNFILKILNEKHNIREKLLQIIDRNNDVYDERDSEYLLMHFLLDNWPFNFCKLLKIISIGDTITLSIYDEFNILIKILRPALQSSVRINSLLCSALKVYFYRETNTYNIWFDMLFDDEKAKKNKYLYNQQTTKEILNVSENELRILEENNFITCEEHNSELFYSAEVVRDLMLSLVFPNKNPSLMYSHSTGEWISFTEAFKHYPILVLIEGIKNGTIRTGINVFKSGFESILLNKSDLLG
ncbi:TniQ family protein [Dethiobacter alkaliphilus]|uniref:TniQ family protein n=1 Tax=Dethiobacter alkaliphilus TaxID=427926 RepID=UPI00222672BE|nr:TniQ family protein [Dethiobacter alkaliphilus]MCW3491345.1 TniQ family protein [Dethiobacter alkaliphilus]